MAYATHNYKTKKALKEAVEVCNKTGDQFPWYQPGPMGKGQQSLSPGESVSLEGPHYPEPHKWYALLKMDYNGKLKVT